MKDAFLKYVKDFSHFTEAELSDNGVVIGYSVVAMNNRGIPLGGGTHSIKNTARAIAVAESLERVWVQIVGMHFNQEFKMTEYPTTCGFAVGYDECSTKERAILEAYERWFREQWIDHKKYIPEHQPSSADLSPIAMFYLKQFDKVLFFKHDFTTTEGDLSEIPLSFGVVVAQKGPGVFCGSRIARISDSSDLWEHGLIEAWRHLTITNLNLAEDYSHVMFQRIFHFGKNGDAAVATIPTKFSTPIRNPRINLINNISLADGIYLWRAICEGFLGWHAGSIDRFVY